MKITPKILSIPPHLSTTWAQVRTLYVKDATLIVALADGAVIPIPGLSVENIEAVFNAHTTFLDTQAQKNLQTADRQPPLHLFQGTPSAPFSAASPPEGSASIRFSFDNMESLSSALHHNPAQARLPNFPDEVLNKIAAITKIVAPEDIQNMPKPEAHCNCPHCQIARAIHGKSGDSVLETSADKGLIPEEEISEKDLAFQQWDITQSGDNLFVVTNRLDTLEKYNVYLGHPVGCTCGREGCEHILAVLKS